MRVVTPCRLRQLSPSKCEKTLMLAKLFTAPSRLLLVLLCAAPLLAQEPSALSGPVLGYLVDADARLIRPIAGIPGNAWVGAPVETPFPLAFAAALPGSAHAIASSESGSQLLVVGLENTAARAIEGAGANPSSVALSSRGSSAALYYAETGSVALIHGLPEGPAVRARIDVSQIEGRLSRMAISDDGTLAAFVFSHEDHDALYVWASSSPPHAPLRLVTESARIAAIALLGDEVIVADRGVNEVFAVRDVRGEAARVFLAGAREGVASPAGLSVSTRNEIYVGNAESSTVMILEAGGRLLRTLQCECAVTTVAPLRDSVFRLTDNLDRPIFLLDAAGDEDQIVFVPAAAPQSEARQDP